LGGEEGQDLRGVEFVGGYGLFYVFDFGAEIPITTRDEAPVMRLLAV
jgi:hypothetical protein